MTVLKITISIVGVIAVLYIVSLLLLVLSVARFTRYWKDLAAKPITNKAMVYVALGDSAAQGVGATSATRGYVGQFAKRLSDKEGRPVHIINLSESGARIQDVVKDQLPLLNNYRPDVITLDIGGNDIANFEAPKFKQEFADLISKLPTNTLVADVPYFGGRTQLPLFGSGRAEKDVLIANTIIKELTANTHISIVSIHDATKARNGRRIWNYAPDYFHPNNLGYRAWTDAFWQAYNK